MEDEKPLLGTIFNPTTLIKRPTWAFLLLSFTTLAVFFLPFTTKTFSSPPSSWAHSRPDPKTCSGFFHVGPPRKFFMSITEFGGVGDGETSNTFAFRNAVEFMKRFENKGGSQLNVPKGRWVTGSFNLTSNFTLFLEEGAVILGSQAC